MKANPLLSFALGMGAAYLIWGMRRSAAAPAAAAPAPFTSTAVTQPASPAQQPATAPGTIVYAPASQPNNALTAYTTAL